MPVECTLQHRTAPADAFTFAFTWHPPVALDGRQVQSGELLQDDGDTYKLARRLYVHGLCLEAAEP